jgi:excisionase family DNA binding protein
VPEAPPAAPPLPDEALLTYADVARIAKVPDRTVRKWVAQGDLRALQLGRHRRIRTCDWDAFLTDRYVA